MAARRGGVGAGYGQTGIHAPLFHQRAECLEQHVVTLEGNEHGQTAEPHGASAFRLALAIGKEAGVDGVGYGSMPIVGAEIGRNVRHQFFRHRHHPCRLTVGVFQQRYLPSVRAPVQFGVEHLVRKVLRDDIGHAVAPGKCLSRTACPLGTVGMDDVGYAVGCHIAGCHLFHGTHPTLHVAVLAERPATQLTVVDLDAVHLPHEWLRSQTATG